MSSNVEEYVPASAMVVVAHPDDAEFMAAGTVAKKARDDGGMSRDVARGISNGVPST